VNVNPNVNHSNDSNHLPNYGSDTPKPGEHVAGSPGYDPKKYRDKDGISGEK